jgi:hypothetical protein
MEPLAAIRQQGYCVLRGVLAKPEMDALRLAFEDEGSGHTEHIDITATTPNADQWMSLARIEPFYSIVVALIGTAFEARVHGRSPRPGGGQQGLHADRPAGKSMSIEATTALWMLDDFTVNNGATRVVPRTHLAGLAVPRHLAQLLNHHRDEVTVTGEAGDVLLFDSHLWHSGQRNSSTLPRRSVQMVG